MPKSFSRVGFRLGVPGWSCLHAGAAVSLFSVALCLLAGSSCGGDGRPPLSGRFAGMEVVFSVSLAEEEREAVEELIERFERQTGAAVTLTSVTAADLPEKLTVDVAAGRPTIDLFAQDNLAVQILVDRGLVEAVGDVPIPDAVPARMIPAPINGRRYYLPFRPNVRVAYVNAHRFQQAGVAPPRTTDELRAVARRLKAVAGDTPKVVLSLAQGDAAAVTISEWIVSFGGSPLALNDEGSVRAFRFLQEMWAEQLLARESLLAKYDTVVDYLQGETAWLAQNWPFTSGVLSNQGLLDRFDVYEGWRGPARAAHVVGGDVLGMPKGVAGKRKAAALQLARFLMSREAQEHLAARNAWPSIRTDAYTRVAPAEQATFAAIAAALADGWYRPNVPYWPTVTEAINEAIRLILEDGEPVREVLDALHAQIARAAEEKGAAYPPERTAFHDPSQLPIEIVGIGPSTAVPCCENL
jgi:trehalose transport system substrate-binding protein